MYSFHESKINQVSEAKQPKISELRPVHEKKQWFCLLCPVCICKTFRHFTHHNLQSASYSKQLILFQGCNWLFLCLLHLGQLLADVSARDQSELSTHPLPPFQTPRFQTSHCRCSSQCLYHTSAGTHETLRKTSCPNVTDNLYKPGVAHHLICIISE